MTLDVRLFNQVPVIYRPRNLVNSESLEMSHYQRFSSTGIMAHFSGSDFMRDFGVHPLNPVS